MESCITINGFYELAKKEIYKYLVDTTVENEFEKHPHLSCEEMAERFINRYAVQTFLIGSAAGTLGIAGIAIETIPIIKIQLKLTTDLAKIYGIEKEINFEDTDTILKLFLLSFGAKSGYYLTRDISIKLFNRYSWKVAGNLGKRMATQNAGKIAPGMSILSGGIINFLVTKHIGYKAWESLKQQQTC